MKKIAVLRFFIDVLVCIILVLGCRYAGMVEWDTDLVTVMFLAAVTTEVSGFVVRKLLMFIYTKQGRLKWE